MASYLAEVVGFLLLLFFAYRYFPWPFLKTLMVHQADAIRSSLSSADTARDGARQALVEARTALEQAHLEATSIIQRAHETSAQLRLDGEARGARTSTTGWWRARRRRPSSSASAVEKR